jgi:hypothetical protein
MKKLYFTLLSIFSGLAFVTAQTLTVANHQPIVGDSYARIQVDSIGANALSAISGSTAVWNFTTAITRTVTGGWYNSANTYTPGSTVNTSALVYPSTAIARVNSTEKSFLTTSSSDLKFWGGKITIATFPADFVLSLGVIYAVYPMVYGVTATTPVFTGTISSGLGAGTISNGTAVVTYDGNGTLNLPSKTFTNVVRLKTRTYFDYSAGISGTVTFDNYDYYDLSRSKHPIFSVASSTITSSIAAPSIQYYAYVNKDYMAIGVNEFSKEIASLNIFPNPAKGNFNISMNNENAEVISYEMINVLGQIVRKENLGNSKGEVKFNIETSGIESGVYFVKVYAGNATSVKKITIQ